MPWSERSTMSLRREFVELALMDGANMQALCERFGISRPTGYKWLHRFEQQGAAGLLDRSRRPHTSPKRTQENMERSVLTLRDEHPAWGTRKIRHLLGTVEDIPSPSTLTQILRRNGRLDPKESAKHRPFKRFEHPDPNLLWQMDFKGHFGLAREGRCHPLTVLDDYSRFCLLLCACRDERTRTVQDELSACFKERGLPEQILCDNGPPWGNASAACGHTALSVWLMRLGIRVCHGRPWHPQTQGKEERFHRTLLDELIRPVMGLCVRWNAAAASPQKPGANPSQSGKAVQVADHGSCQMLFDSWRSSYNYVRPHQAIDLRTPASRYQPSPRLFPCRNNAGKVASYEKSGRSWLIGLNGIGVGCQQRHAALRTADRCFVMFSGRDTNCTDHILDKNPAISRVAGVRDFLNRRGNLGQRVVGAYHFQLDIRNGIHEVL